MILKLSKTLSMSAEDAHVEYSVTIRFEKLSGRFDANLFPPCHYLSCSLLVVCDVSRTL